MRAAQGAGSRQAALAQVALHVCDWLDASALGRLEQSCAAVRAALGGETAWRSVLRDARRRRGRVLSLWRSVAGVLAGAQLHEVCASRQVLSALSLRCSLEVRLFLPEMLGYSLIHPCHSSRSFSVLLSEASGESCAAVRRLAGAVAPRDWVLLVSSGAGGERLTFDSPYKTYWLNVEPRLSGGARRDEGRVVSCGAHELLSLSAHVIAEVEHVRSHSDDRSPMQRQMHASPGYFTSTAIAIAAAAAAASGAARAVPSSAGAASPAAAAAAAAAARAGSQRGREDGEGRTTAWVSSALPGGHPQPDGQAPPSVCAFFLVDSSTKSSTVHVERLAVAIARRDYVRLAASALLGSVEPL
jgi:hypothetical protein